MERATRMADVLALPPDAEVGLYDLAPVYDFVYRRTFDYDRQADLVRRVADDGDGDGGVLELACGTGALAARLAGDRPYVGVDASASMLAVARRHADGAALVRGDARRFALERRFGAVAMLGRSATHFGRADLSAVAEVAREHLADGALLLDAHDRAALEDGHVSEDHHESDRWTVVYRGESTALGDGRCLHDYGFDVTDRETGRSRTFEGTYEMRFWGAAELEALLRASGFGRVRLESSDGHLLARAEPA